MIVMLTVRFYGRPAHSSEFVRGVPRKQNQANRILEPRLTCAYLPFASRDAGKAEEHALLTNIIQRRGI